MTYIEKHNNKEIQEYFKILSNDYPTFIDKYIDTKEMQRLSGIGQFCGCDYTKLHSIKYWYSRLDHSVACALMTWHFTKDKVQTLGALFHDLGTPVFSHCVDYLFKDFINQESSEKNIKDVILSSTYILNYLKEDNINLDSVTDISQYTIVENKKPKICVDRLEGIIGTGLVWGRFWNIEDIEKMYNDIIVLNNEDQEKEIGFSTIQLANDFFEGVFKYSIMLQQNEDKFTMQFIADCLKELIDDNIISIEDLYSFSEQDIITMIKVNKKTKLKWNTFVNSSVLIKTEEAPSNNYYISVDCKKRYVVPLVRDNEIVTRLNKVSKRCEELLEKYLIYSDTKYAYIEFLK